MAFTSSNLSGGFDFESRDSARQATYTGASYVGSNSAVSYMQNSNYDSLGISGPGARDAADKISSLIVGLEDYYKNLTIDSEAISEAVQGKEYVPAIENYLSKTRTYLASAVSDLKQLSDKLITVADAWEEFQRQKAQELSQKSDEAYSSVIDEYQSTSIPSNGSIPGGR